MEEGVGRWSPGEDAAAGARPEPSRPPEDALEGPEETFGAEEHQKTSGCGTSRRQRREPHAREQPPRRPRGGENFGDGSDLASRRPEKPHLCSECGKSFTRRFNLKLHEKLHTGERPHSCPECGLSFTSTSHLMVHQRIHTGERPYRCHVCGKGFAMSSKCLEHERTHTGEAPYGCPACANRYRTKVSLASHLKTHLG